MDLYILVSQTVAILLTLLVFIGMTPQKMRTWIIAFVRFVRSHPQTIVVLLVLVISNLIIITMNSVGYVRILGIIGNILAGVILAFSIGRYSTRRVSSLHTNVLAVLTDRFDSISELPTQTRIVTPPYGPWLEWMHTALETYQKSFVPVVVPRIEQLEALKRGVVDAILLKEHPSMEMDNFVASGRICILPWSKDAVERVVKSFPSAVRPSILPPNTYHGQPAEIQGYAPF
jgi:hypothetical protein